MPRALSIQYPSAIYRVMNRGDRREPNYEVKVNLEEGLSRTLDYLPGEQGENDLIQPESRWRGWRVFG